VFVHYELGGIYRKRKWVFGDDLETDVRRMRGVRFSSQRTARPPAKITAEMPASI